MYFTKTMATEVRTHVEKFYTMVEANPTTNNQPIVLYWNYFYGINIAY